MKARDAVRLVAAATVLLVLFEGSGVESGGKQIDPGTERSIVLAIGKPTGWIADRLPFSAWADSALAFISPDEDLSGQKGFDEQPTEGNPGKGPSPVTVDQFDPAALGAKPKSPGKLKTLLVTGDSLSLPLDSELAKRLTVKGVKVVRDPHVGTGISKAGVVDWAKLSAQQVDDHHPDAVVVFIGANEGFNLPGAGGKQVSCCGPDWAAVYAQRARRLMDNYRQGGDARVYWLEVPLPRDSTRQRVQRTVNAAFEVAAQPWRSQIRLLDLTTVFTPHGKYRDAMEVNGRKQIVREPDGNHLNRKGAEVAAGVVLKAVQRDFGGPG